MFSCLDNVAPGFLLGPSTFSQLGSDHAWVTTKKKHVLVVWPLVSLATTPNCPGHEDYTTVNYSITTLIRTDVANEQEHVPNLSKCAGGSARRATPDH